MPFMNEMEIDELVQICERDHPTIAPYARFLSDWRHIVNRNSDGWHMWPGGYKAAGKLIALLEPLARRSWGWQTGEPARPAIADLKRALGPIRACCTRKGLPRPELAA